jgi:hypothetical protein
LRSTSVERPCLGGVAAASVDVMVRFVARVGTRQPNAFG